MGSTPNSQSSSWMGSTPNSQSSSMTSYNPTSQNQYSQQEPYYGQGEGVGNLYAPPTQQYAGRKRKMRGGFYPNNQPTGPAVYASQYSGTTVKANAYGGRRSRKMRGGYNASSPMTGLAVYAAPYSGTTANAHNWVGGKKRRTIRRSRKH